MLGDQPATGERGGELGICGGDAHVAHHRVHEADARARAVDGGDDRLGDAEGVGHGPRVVPLGGVLALSR